MKFIYKILIATITLFFISCGSDSTLIPLSDISGIKINETNTTIYSTDAPSNLTATVSFTDGTNADLTTIAKWTSSDTTLLSVTKGSIQALKNGGVANLNISYKNLTSQSVVVNVLKVLDYNISLINADANATGTYDILATAKFEDNTSKTIVKNITWDLNNSAIITGEGNTTQIQITTTGDTNITAKLFDDINMTQTIIYHAD
jgi:hypothetical protein